MLSVAISIRGELEQFCGEAAGIWSSMETFWLLLFWVSTWGGLVATCKLLTLCGRLVAGVGAGTRVAGLLAFLLRLSFDLLRTLTAGCGRGWWRAVALRCCCFLLTFFPFTVACYGIACFCFLVSCSFWLVFFEVNASACDCWELTV